MCQPVARLLVAELTYLISGPYLSSVTWRATVLTLFPEMFPGPLGVSLAGKALHLACGRWRRATSAISATDKHRTVDDTPAGGGPGMVLRADVLAAAIDARRHRPSPALC